jgi:nucleotide-binding universal stress UspA family protein
MIDPIRSIVVGVATLDEEDPALTAALELARALSAEVHAVHVYDLPAPIQHAYARRGLLDPSLFQRYGDELKRRLQQQVEQRAAGASVVCHLGSGEVAEELIKVVTTVGAGLLVIGATRRGRLWRRLLGSAAERMIRSSPVPVLVLRQGFAREVRRVLFTTDLSELSGEVHRTGLELVRFLADDEPPELRSLLVVKAEGAAALALHLEHLSDVAQQELEAFLDEVGVGGRTEPTVRVGDPAEQILSAAAEWPADLIVLGTQGRTGLQRVLLGSVAGAALRGAACNVLVIPAGAAPRPA